MDEKPSVPLIRDILIYLPVGIGAGIISGVINGLLDDDLTIRGLLIHTAIFGPIWGVIYGFSYNRWFRKRRRSKWATRGSGGLSLCNQGLCRP